MYNIILYILSFICSISFSITTKQTPTENISLNRFPSLMTTKALANPNIFDVSTVLAIGDIKPQIIIPDIKPILCVIEETGNIISKETEKILTVGKITIEEIINKVSTNNTALIEPVLLAGNEKIKNSISKSFSDTIISLTEFVDKITSGEIADTKTQINYEMKNMLLSIENLFKLLNKEINSELQKSYIQEKDTVTQIVNDNNNTVKDQIVVIINDPDNNKPILNQLIYPDPQIVTDTIISIKKDLLVAIILLIDKLNSDANKTIIETTTNILENQEDLVDKGNILIIDGFTNILNKMMNDITVSIENTSKQEIDKIQPILKSGNVMIKNEIINVVGKMNYETNKMINEVTIDEINQIIILLAKNNDDIIQQILSMLNTNN
ncbi:hypothetical protein TCON_1206 [Astathelohania contejeani]|uniref:Uncharacterized protein n=1 Tax=Astathelohania contejeani TaxID=164912 RepID=A0ABQ7HZM8_9MICR|nr:hypothetical protein TCON_1206 [Thelohania contejeani]